MWGADVAQLRTLAQHFGKTADQLLQQSAQLSSQINNTRAWKGADAERFQSDWNKNHRLLLQQAAARLKQESRLLLRNADEQDTASNAGGGPDGQGNGPGIGHTGDSTVKDVFGPPWLADEQSPFREGWNAYGLAKAFPNLRAGLFDIGAMLHDSRRAAFFDRVAWRTFQNTNEFSRFFNMSNSLFEGKLHEVLSLSNTSNAFKYLDAAGKGLGLLGVGLDGLDAYNHLQAKEYGDAAYSTTKVLLGAGSFLPPPAGTVCMVASGALALYDNVPVIHDSVNYVGGKIADGANAVGDAVSDGADAVGDFFGF